MLVMTTIISLNLSVIFNRGNVNNAFGVSQINEDNQRIIVCLDALGQNCEGTVVHFSLR